MVAKDFKRKINVFLVCVCVHICESSPTFPALKVLFMKIELCRGLAREG